MHHPITKKTTRLGQNQPSRREDTAHGARWDWQRHVDAGRIGSRPSRPFDLRFRMMRNEIALFGRVVTRELEEF